MNLFASVCRPCDHEQEQLNHHHYCFLCHLTQSLHPLRSLLLLFFCMIVNSIVKIKYRTQTCDIQSWERAYPKLWQIQSWTVQTCLNTSCRNISYLQLPWGWQVIFLSGPCVLWGWVCGFKPRVPNSKWWNRTCQWHAREKWARSSLQICCPRLQRGCTSRRICLCLGDAESEG